MNDDDYWNIISGSTRELATRELYDLLKNYGNYKDYNRKDDMAYSYSRGYYEDTSSKEVATAALEAYADGVPFETLIKKNKAVRQYWYSIQSERAARLKRAEQEKTRLAKLAEKQAAEKAQREEVMTKLTKEELEAFGLVRKGKR
jgi:monoamine oxidase